MTDRPPSPSSARPPSAVLWWGLVALVLAVVVTATVLGLRALLPAGRRESVTARAPSATDQPVAPQRTPGSPTSSAPSPSPAGRGAPVVLRAGTGPLLPGIGTGQVYAESATGIFRIELGTGRVTRTTTPDLEEHVTFLAGRDWVLVKSRWSPTGVVVHDGRPASPLPRELEPEGLLHPGPGGRLWVEPEPGTDPTPTTTLQLVELDGRPVPGRTVTAPRTSAPYAIVADGFGGLLMTNRGGIYRLDQDGPGRPTQIRLITRGDLVAAGGHRLLVWHCGTDARCRLELVDQQTRRRTELPAAARTFLGDGGIGIDGNDFSDDLLSPDGTHLAVMADDRHGVFRVHVVDLRTGADTVLPGAGTDANANRQLAWSRNSRWLLALTDHQIHGYDTRAHAAGDVPLGGEQLLHLTTAEAPGW